LKIIVLGKPLKGKGTKEKSEKKLVAGQEREVVTNSQGSTWEKAPTSQGSSGEGQTKGWIQGRCRKRA